MAHAKGAGWHVEEVPGRGRAVIADRLFQAGEVVLVDDPYAWDLYTDQLPQHCSCCLGAPVPGGAALLRCSGCRAARYLGRDHQRRHWAAGHREECAALRAAPGVPPATVRLAVRCALRRHRERQQQQQQQQQGEAATGAAAAAAAHTYAEVEAVQHHWDVLPDGQKIQMAQMASVAWRLLGAASEAAAAAVPPRELAMLLARFAANNHTICDDELRPLGVGLYPLACMANHSCRPSCVQSFDGPRMLFRAVRRIDPGDEVTIAYVELAAPRWERRRQLLEQYHFDLDAGQAGNSPGIEQETLALPGGRLHLHALLPGGVPPWPHDDRDTEMTAVGRPGSSGGGGAEAPWGGMWGALRAHEPQDQGTQSFDVEAPEEEPDSSERGQGARGAPEGGASEQPGPPPAAEIHYWSERGMPDEHRAAVLELAAAYGDALRLLRHAEDAAAGPPPLAELRAALGRLGCGARPGGSVAARRGPALGPRHVLRTRLQALALRCAIAAGDWGAALGTARELAGQYDWLYPEVWPALGLHWAQLAKLESLVGEPLRALRAAQRAEAALGGAAARGAAAEEARRVAAQAAQELRHAGLPAPGEGACSDGD